jgi:YVTN family beta-propeller protein
MTATTRLAFPAGAAYVEALQHPEVCFDDPELAAGTVETTPLGLPRPRSGAASCVFSVATRPGTRLAVKCFTRAAPDLQQRYSIIAEHLASGRAAPWQVSFDYRPRGVLVTGRWWPTVVMEWVSDAIELARYVEDHLAEPARLGRVATTFARACVDLREQQVAHGDLQHGNILVTGDEQIRLVDYDGMWVPALAEQRGIERGHPNYQPPQRRVPDAGAGLDHFSSWVIYISLLTTAVDATVWQRLDGGDECLLFRQADLQDPATSPAFAALAACESELVRAAGAHLAQLCRLDSPLHAPPLDPDELPAPTDLPQRRHLPPSTRRPSQRRTIPYPAPPPRNGDVPVVRPAPPTPSTPNPAPTHQSSDDTPDSTGGGWGFLWMIALIVFNSWFQHDERTVNPPPDPPALGQGAFLPSLGFGVFLPGGQRAHLTADGVVIDTSSVGPGQSGISPDFHRLYIANPATDSVSVTDIASGALTKITIAVGDSPKEVVLSPDGQHAYVTYTGSGSVSVIDTAINEVTATIAVGDSPEHLVVSPDGRYAYVTHTGSRSVSVIDTVKNAVTDTVIVNEQ